MLMDDGESSSHKVFASRIDFEAALFRQEHRFFSILWNFFVIRPTLPDNDRRRTAITESLLWRIAVSMAPGIAVTGGGIIAVTGLAVAIWANSLLAEQNKTLAKQNDLLELQSEKLDSQITLLETQNQLSEAVRRSELLGEVANLINEIEEFIESEETQSKDMPSSGWRLHTRLYRKTRALANNLRPYQYVRPKGSMLDSTRNFETFSVIRGDVRNGWQPNAGGDLSPKSLSPERGFLLLMLCALEVDLKPLAELNTSFAYADCHDSELQGVVLEGLDLSGADFSGANLAGSSFREAWLFGANLSYANLQKANLTGAYFTDADLTNTEFSLANVSGTSYSPSFLKGRGLAGAQVSSPKAFELLFSEDASNLRKQFTIEKFIDNSGSPHFVIQQVDGPQYVFIGDDFESP